MRKTSVIGATLVAAAMLCAAPISLHQAQDQGLSLSVDKAQAYYGHYRRVNRRHGYYNHGHHYNYRYHGGYYNHRVYRHHHYRYY